LCSIQIWEAGSNAARACDNSGNAEANVVSALIADDLQWQARRGLALDRRAAILVEQLARERRQKTARGRPKADAGNVNVDGRTLDGRLVFSAQVMSSMFSDPLHSVENHLPPFGFAQGRLRHRDTEFFVSIEFSP
jgi:hypothetical protein